jgi:hypothetical protein
MTTAGVVPLHSCIDVGRESGVMPRRIVDALENVHATWQRHRCLRLQVRRPNRRSRDLVHAKMNSASRPMVAAVRQSSRKRNSLITGLLQRWLGCQRRVIAVRLRGFAATARQLSRTALLARIETWLAELKLARVPGERKLEAAGVEPASENMPSQESTCVAALEDSQPPSKSDGNRRSLAPNGSRRHPSEPPVTTSLHL